MFDIYTLKKYKRKLSIINTYIFYLQVTYSKVCKKKQHQINSFNKILFKVDFYMFLNNIYGLKFLQV